VWAITVFEQLIMSVAQYNGRRWGVAQGCKCQSILDAIATLIEGQRPDLALDLIEQELNSQF